MIMDSQNSQAGSIKNTVEYELYLSKIPDAALIEGYRELIRPILKDLFDEFELHMNLEQKLCHGSIRVDQSIEREWLIVYALYDLSRADKDLAIKIQDSDGDILLIEAAEKLPKWLESSKSKNRVFIHQGKLHIIPEHVNLKDLLGRYENCHTVTQAAACFVRDMNSQKGCKGAVRTLADESIQNAIEEQLSGMPDQKAWLSRKFQQLDEIISGQEGTSDAEQLQKKFQENITLAAVMAMDDEDLKISPISSRSSSSSKSSSSSTSWLTEQEDD